MTQRILYPKDGGGIAVVIPTPEALELIGIEAIAQKDVPAGVPYKIVTVSDLPADRSERELWTANFTNPDGTGAA